MLFPSYMSYINLNLRPTYQFNLKCTRFVKCGIKPASMDVQTIYDVIPMLLPIVQLPMLQFRTF